MYVQTYGESDFQAVRGVAERLVAAQGGNVQQWRESMRRMNQQQHGHRDGKRSRSNTNANNNSDTDTAPENNGNEGFPPPPAKKSL